MRPAFSVGAPLETYSAPPELGGARPNIPVLDNLVPDVLQEVGASYAQAAAQYGNGLPTQQYDGDVWSVQLTARPGYYVAPEIQEELGWIDMEVPPNG